MDLVLGLERWIHFLSGVTWVGLLYYFNFVQIPALAEASADADGPGPAAIARYVAPRALRWFRWASVVTWLSGIALIHSTAHLNVMDAFALRGASQTIGVGAWLGTIMLVNVWVLIWPNQKKVLKMVPATEEEVAKARSVATLTSRVNTLLSIPMLLFMGMSSHAHIF